MNVLLLGPQPAAAVTREAHLSHRQGSEHDASGRGAALRPDGREVADQRRQGGARDDGRVGDAEGAAAELPPTPVDQVQERLPDR